MAWTDTINAIAAAASALAAGAAWRAARHSNQTADAVARIEAERRHLERTPQIDLDFTYFENVGRANLHVYLNGPDELDHLDEISIRVENDDMDRAGFIQRGSGVTEEQIARKVWGPFRFAAGANGVDPDGRTVDSFPLVVGTGQPLSMERTMPGPWMSMGQAAWQQQNAQIPIRLRLACRSGDEEWVLTKRIPNPPMPTP